MQSSRISCRQHFFFAFVSILVAAGYAWASPDQSDASLPHIMADLVIQLGCILLAGRVGGMIFEKLRLPPVLGELMAGVAIGPFALGKIPLPGMPLGLFGEAASSLFPVSIELYSFATLASIILLFMAGLETDLALFLKFSLVSSAVGIGGVIASFVLGAAIGPLFLGLSFADPQTMFLGIICTATSVGITARILSEKKKTGSPEGVTILGAAVIDDVLGILFLAVVVGVTAPGLRDAPGAIGWTAIGVIILKAAVVFVGCSTLLLLFAEKIGVWLKRFKLPVQGTIMSLALALLLAGFFEKAGLAMIIGAYLMGLTLSKTDLALVIGETLRPVYSFLVPVFFVIMGMLVNIGDIASLRIIQFGLVYTLAAVAAKLAGCGLAAIPFKFNAIGALRIGLGMVPRGEVALIIAGIGLSTGMLQHDIFSGAVLMTLLTTLLAPPLLSLALMCKTRGTRTEVAGAERVTTVFEFGSADVTLLAETKMLEYLRAEGFFVIGAERERGVWHARKESAFFILRSENGNLLVESDAENTALAKTIIYEALLDLQMAIGKVQKTVKPEALRRDVAAGIQDSEYDARGIFDPRCIILAMKSGNKDDAIRELTDSLYKMHKLSDRAKALQSIFERERSMSTGMQNGIAMPHGRCSGVAQTVAAVGIAREGIDFSCIDGKPAQLIILIVYPEESTGPHMRFLAGLAGLLNQEAVRARLLCAKSAAEVYRILTVPQT